MRRARLPREGAGPAVMAHCFECGAAGTLTQCVACLGFFCERHLHGPAGPSHTCLRDIAQEVPPLECKCGVTWEMAIPRWMSPVLTDMWRRVNCGPGHFQLVAEPRLVADSQTVPLAMPPREGGQLVVIGLVVMLLAGIAGGTLSAFGFWAWLYQQL